LLRFKESVIAQIRYYFGDFGNSAAIELRSLGR
jgi:hypothetical protein